MPQLEVSDLFQYGLRWSQTGNRNRYGSPEYVGPTEINCRLEKVRRQISNDNAIRGFSEASLFTDTPLAIGDVFWHGELSEWNESGSGSVGVQPTLYEVALDETTPDIKARNTRYEYALIFFKGAIPE